MFRFTCAFAIAAVLTAPAVLAADLPVQLPSHKLVKLVKKTKAVADKELPHDSQAKPTRLQAAATPKADAASTQTAKDGSANLSWTLDTLIANADGGKDEGSASMIGSLAVAKSVRNLGPQLTIELIGHIVKTSDSSVRIDIQIGDVKHSVVWKNDEVKSGQFKIFLDEKMPAGGMPGRLAASALAMVTKQGDGRAAMVSLEKINLHLGKYRVAGVEE
jgi:hypothetical protein